MLSLHVLNIGFHWNPASTQSDIQVIFVHDDCYCYELADCVEHSSNNI